MPLMVQVCPVDVQAVWNCVDLFPPFHPQSLRLLVQVRELANTAGLAF